MLNQATGANVANQAALMAGQRGSSANVGLLARQAAQQGANTQQQAAGQGATMQAQQSLGALQNLGNLANTQVNQQVGATGAVTQGQQNEQTALLNAIAQQNNSRVHMQSNVNSSNAGLAGNVLGQQQGAISGLAGGLTTGLMMLADGGEVQHYDNGGNVLGQYNPLSITPQTPSAGPQSGFGKFLQGMQSAESAKNPVNAGFSSVGNALGKSIRSMFSTSAPQSKPDDYSASGMSPEQMDQERSRVDMQTSGGLPDPNSPAAQVSTESRQDMPASNDSSDVVQAAEGGKVPALVSPGEKYLSPRDVNKVKAGANPMQVGETIPGKPKVGGAKNSYKNDTVPKTLEEGGIVLPRSVTQAKHPHWAAHKFVMEVMRKKGKK